VSISLRGLNPDVRAAAEAALSWAGYYRIPVTVTSAARPWAQQAALRAQYEACLARGEKISPANPDARCRYPANEPGDSAHNYGLAWDSVVPEEWWAAWTFLRRAAGFAVPDGDRVHAEVPSWRGYLA